MVDDKAMPTLVPQPHGGALLRGGVPGNRGGGRPPKNAPNPNDIIATIDGLIQELATLKRKVRQFARAARDRR